MKIPIIKALVENASLAELQEAEEALIEEKQPAIAIGGADEGEQLTHVLAAIFILHEMKLKGIAFKDALRVYTQRVRTSIS